MKTILITGGAGFLGRYTAQAFAASGWKVVGLGHADSHFLAKSWGYHDFTIGDVDSQSLQQVIDLHGAPNVCLHAAGSGSVGRSWEDPAMDFAHTVVTTAAVIEMLRTCAPECQLIYPSSAALYGEASAATCKENDTCKPMSPYGLHKLLAEELCESASRIYGLRVAVIRFFSLYGPGLQKQLLWDVSQKLQLCGNVLELDGTGEELRDFLYIDDAVGLIESIAVCPQNYVMVNGATGIATSVSAAAEQLAQAMQLQVTIQFSGKCRAGNPTHLVGDTKQLEALGFKAKTNFSEGIISFVESLPKVAKRKKAQ